MESVYLQKISRKFPGWEKSGKCRGQKVAIELLNTFGMSFFYSRVSTPRFHAETTPAETTRSRHTLVIRRHSRFGKWENYVMT